MSHDPDPLRGDPFTHLDGPYLLGALSAEEHAAYEKHLETCAACRASLDELSSVLPHLALSDESMLDVPSTPPLPDTLLPRLLSEAGRSVRRRRTLIGALTALTAACLVTVMILAATLVGGAKPSGRQMTALGASPVTAEVALQPTAWGTEIDLTCWYSPGASVAAGYAYALSVRGADGRSHELGTWQLAPGKRVTFTTGTALTVDQISAIDIVDPYGTRLLTLKT